MEVELHDGARQPRKLQCTRLVVRDEYGQPQALVISPARGQIWVSHRGKPGWDRALQAVGIQDTTITHVVQGDAVEAQPGKLTLPGQDHITQ